MFPLVQGMSKIWGQFPENMLHPVPASLGHAKKYGVKFLNIFRTHVPTSWIFLLILSTPHLQPVWHPGFTPFAIHGGGYNCGIQSSVFGYLVNSRGPTKNYLFMSPPQVRGLVPRSWYQKNGELERRSLSKICEGARGAAGPPPGGLEAPQELQAVWGAAAPQ